ncbi:MAG: glucose-6-phosphate isomerase [Actinomycetota bacterium]
MAISWRCSRTTEAITSRTERWDQARLIDRLWECDPTVWSREPVPEIEDRLGWLTLPATSRDLVGTIEELHDAAVAAGITHIVLLGMGGSSLAPEVFASSLPHADIDPLLVVLDSTHPDAVAAVQAGTDPHTTWYVVASKSGTTLETMSFFHWFWAVADGALDAPGEHFIAITDPGTPLDTIASQRSFRATISADPTVGGRYSALTAFGLVPAGLTGANLTALLDAAADAAAMCGPHVALDENPAFVLGALLGTEALSGNDKAHIVASEPVSALPIWTEQLIAESTGKDGKGIVPVDGGPNPSRATDGIVVGIGGEPIEGTDFMLTVADADDIAAAMFVLELATAIAGEILGIHPFNQPDVQIAKKLAASAMAGELEKPAVPPIAVSSEGLDAALSELFAEPNPSYVSIHAYLAPTPETDRHLDAIRNVVDRTAGVYTTAGYGPRFLHSTGQVHKGGPAGGLFLQIIDTPSAVLPVPGSAFSFNELIAAQAEGDLAALASKGRNALSVDLGSGSAQGFDLLLIAIDDALS